jgi:hypothetical protein
MGCGTDVFGMNDFPSGTKIYDFYIFDFQINMYINGTYEQFVTYDFKIYGQAGSFAEIYAEENRIEFVAVDPPILEIDVDEPEPVVYEIPAASEVTENPVIDDKSGGIWLWLIFPAAGLILAGVIITRKFMKSF